MVISNCEFRQTKQTSVETKGKTLPVPGKTLELVFRFWGRKMPVFTYRINYYSTVQHVSLQV